ncbi:MAG: bifunctional transcriptional activator/DNA repair protein Ada [Verrucomicrobia bacterium]|nr:bifunctional transcriptional activator/DNA repair protein Ada [Verrucomicrobiota bacterium]
MQRAFFASDASYDGIFWTGVRTTGIFCRPSCPAKKPRPENVEFFCSVGDAMFAGYRACKRCLPLETDGRPPDWVAALLAHVESAGDERITADTLRELGIEPTRARRWFLQHYSMTFAAYCRARRLQRAFTQLREGVSLDDVALGHGYESHSGFRDAFGKTFGAAPGGSRDGDCIVTKMIESPLGPLIAGATNQGICLLEFTDRRMIEGQLEAIRRCFQMALVPGEHAHLTKLEAELARYFAGKLRSFETSLVAPGSEFQERVWAELQRIPYGETISYVELARRVGRAGAQRAVGHANGLNRLAIVIPCHRVVNASGELGGYGGGLWRKRLLLELERTSQPICGPVARD